MHKMSGNSLNVLALSSRHFTCYQTLPLTARKPTVAVSELPSNPYLKAKNNLGFQSAQQGAQGCADDVALPPQAAQLPNFRDHLPVGAAQPQGGLPFVPVLSHPPSADKAASGLSHGVPEPHVTKDKDLYGAGVAEIHGLDSPTEAQSVELHRATRAEPLGWLFERAAERDGLTPKPAVEVSFPDRVRARLVQAEAHEQDVWFREDYRQAFIVLTLAQRGNTEPFLVSSYQMYGLAPAKLWPARVARRKADLGPEYSKWYDHNDNLRPNPDLLPCPRKPVQSVRTLLKENTDAA